MDDLSYELIIYFDQKSFLSELKNNCEKYLEELTDSLIGKFPPFRFLLEIDVLDLIDLFPDLGSWLLKEPLKFQRACRDILYACLQTVNVENKAVKSAQVGVNLRLKCVPQLVVRPNQRSYAGLISFCGLLLSYSKPESNVYHTVWSCPEECEGNEVILHFIPKVAPKCYVCKSLLFENSGLRRCGERVTATFKLKDSLLPKRFTIVEDLIPRLKPGARYNIYATTAKKATTVLSLEESVSLSAPVTSPVPADIKDLYNTCKGIPWQFIYCLASSIGVNVCPQHHFMHLKICLLLSLASIKANTRTGSRIIHVLAMGSDTGYVGRLMERAAAALAERAVLLGTGHTAAAAALVASSGGVCVMALPLHAYNQRLTAAILASVESREVQTEAGAVRLQAAVWAQGADCRRTVTASVAGVFGTVCRGDTGDHNDEIVDFALQNACESADTSEDERRAMRDIAAYVDLVAGVEVTLDEGAETLLREYFLAVRRERPGGVAAGGLGALAAACVAAARLAGRARAGAGDALLAAWLHAAGAPEPRFVPDQYLQTPSTLHKLHDMMTDFKDWLRQFTGTCIP